MIKQKVAVVTGGARGIGNSIALKLGLEGYAIAIYDKCKLGEVHKNIKKIQDAEVFLMYYHGDISNRKNRIEFCNRVMQRFGRIDILVNNAGVAPKKRYDILDTTEKSFDYVININLKGTFFLTQLVAKIMIDETSNFDYFAPKIINIGSASSYTSSTSRGEYCISKAGLSMLTKLFADKLAQHRINVYEIQPGIIFTDMTKVVKDKYDKLIKEGLIPIKRWGRPEDVANAVSILCSGKLDFSTGEIINVDGGFHLRRL